MLPNRVPGANVVGREELPDNSAAKILTVVKLAGVVITDRERGALLRVDCAVPAMGIRERVDFFAVLKVPV